MFSDSTPSRFIENLPPRLPRRENRERDRCDGRSSMTSSPQFMITEPWVGYRFIAEPIE